MHIRVCRECGEEYRPEVAVCADCGGVLGDRYEEEGAPHQPSVPEPAASAPPATADLRAIASGPRAADLEPLARRLGAAQIPFAVRGSSQLFELLVGKPDLERALTELAPLGDAPGSSEAPEGTGQCPACGFALRPGATECPDCGLAVGDAGDARVCPHCGVPIGPDDATCPSCRVKIDG
jgi:hypothetical protein